MKPPKKLKRQKEKGRLSVKPEPKPKRVSFSYAHLTTNKRYNFDYFQGDLRKEIEARRGLDELLQTLSKSTWLEIGQRNHKSFGGRELLKREEIYFEPSGEGLTADEKVCVFRFKSSDCRLLGIRENGGDVLYIIGFDFKFNAYDHGS